MREEAEENRQGAMFKTITWTRIRVLGVGAGARLGVGYLTPPNHMVHKCI